MTTLAPNSDVVLNPKYPLGILTKDQAILRLGESDGEEGLNVGLLVPHGVVGAVQHLLGPPDADQRGGLLGRQGGDVRLDAVLLTGVGDAGGGVHV